MRIRRHQTKRACTHTCSTTLACSDIVSSPHTYLFRTRPLRNGSAVRGGGIDTICLCTKRVCVCACVCERANAHSLTHSLTYIHHIHNHIGQHTTTRRAYTPHTHTHSYSYTSVGGRQTCVDTSVGHSVNGLPGCSRALCHQSSRPNLQLTSVLSLQLLIFEVFRHRPDSRECGAGHECARAQTHTHTNITCTHSIARPA